MLAAASMVLHTFCSAACPRVTFVRVHATFFFVCACVCVMCLHDYGFTRGGVVGGKKKYRFKMLPFVLNSCSRANGAGSPRVIPLLPPPPHLRSLFHPSPPLPLLSVARLQFPIRGRRRYRAAGLFGPAPSPPGPSPHPPVAHAGSLEVDPG